MCRLRYSRGRRLLTIPPAYDQNANDPGFISAALAAGLYPKILSVELAHSKLETITNRVAASIHPSSVNFGTRIREWESRYLAFFTLMQSKRLYARETGPVQDVALMLLCGEPSLM